MMVWMVYCFDCGRRDRVPSPPRCCRLCSSPHVGSCPIGAGPDYDMWSVSLVGDSAHESHAVQRVAVGELVQAIVDVGLREGQMIVAGPLADHEVRPDMPTGDWTVPRPGTVGH